MQILYHLLIATTALAAVSAFTNNCNDNLAVYWGQNSYGAANPSDKAGWQKPLKEYCADDTIDTIPIAFLTDFNVGDLPSINLASACNAVDNSTFPGTKLADCTALAKDIEFCQQKGKILTMSLGGATGQVGFQSDSDAEKFADTIWNVFLGGSSKTRPFGDAVLDGVDLDIEGGGAKSYPAFLKKLKGYMDGDKKKKYYITAAPQCVFPDANLDEALKNFPFDAIYVQFYNNPCGLQVYGQPQWNYGVWDYWARRKSPNPDVKIYIGAPASASAAGGGYVAADKLSEIALDTQKKFPNFGGVMFWDASQAAANGHIDATIKKALKKSGSCGKSFNPPKCDAQAFKKGTNYNAKQQVVFDGYLWEASWSASEEPNLQVGGSWTPVAACSPVEGSGNPDPTPTSPSTKPTNTAAPTTTKTAEASSTPTLTCPNVASWSAKHVYPAKATVMYQSKAYTAKVMNMGVKPSIKGNVWKELDQCPKEGSKDQTPADGCQKVAAWKPEKTYKAGDKAKINNTVYVASMWNLNQKPNSNSKSTIWVVDTMCNVKAKLKDLLPKLPLSACKFSWDVNMVYRKRSLVGHDGHLYKANFATRGEEPGAYESSSWSRLAACDDKNESIL